MKKLKSYMAHTPILRLPDLNEPFILRTDASNVGLGAVLMQKFNDMNFPIAYASIKTVTQRNKVFSHRTRVLSLSVGCEEISNVFVRQRVSG